MSNDEAAGELDEWKKNVARLKEAARLEAEREVKAAYDALERENAWFDAAGFEEFKKWAACDILDNISKKEKGTTYEHALLLSDVYEIVDKEVLRQMPSGVRTRAQPAKESPAVEAAPWDDEEAPPEPSASPMPAAPPAPQEAQHIKGELPEKTYAPFIPEKHERAFCKYWSRERVFEVGPGRCAGMHCDVYTMNMVGDVGKGEVRIQEKEFPYACRHCTKDRAEAVKAMEEYRKSVRAPMVDEGFITSSTRFRSNL